MGAAVLERRNPLIMAITIGLLGGIALAATEGLSTCGILILIPYALVVLSTVVVVKQSRPLTY